MSDDELRNGTLQLPAALNKERKTLESFQSSCHRAALVVLSQLADTLDLPALKDYHLMDKSSESGLKLITEPTVARVADVLENKHRDSGTLTVLFYDSWGVHVCLSEEGQGKKDWVFVPPPPQGCALVHGASSLARLSGGRLRAPLHRVTQVSDGAEKRYFLSYFLRPEHGLREEWASADAISAAA